MRYTTRLAAIAVGVGLTLAGPAFAQPAAQTTGQNAAAAGGQPGAAGDTPRARPHPVMRMPPQTDPSAPHSGVSDDAAAGGGAR